MKKPGRSSITFRLIAASAVLCWAFPLLAHVTPNVQLIRHGDFLREGLPGAKTFFEKHLKFSRGDLAAVRRSTQWSPSAQDTRVYDGRSAGGTSVGTVIFLWMASEHGPIGLGIAFDPAGTIRQVAVTDAGSEPLAWVRPLVAAQGLSSLNRLGPGEAPDPRKIAPAATGKMNRYYARVIARGVARAQALERIFRDSPPPAIK